MFNYLRFCYSAAGAIVNKMIMDPPQPSQYFAKSAVSRLMVALKIANEKSHIAIQNNGW